MSEIFNGVLFIMIKVLSFMSTLKEILTLVLILSSVLELYIITISRISPSDVLCIKLVTFSLFKFFLTSYLSAWRKI